MTEEGSFWEHSQDGGWVIPTSSPWAWLPHGMNVPQSPGLGHMLMSKHLGQEAFCLTPEEPHSQREEAGAP